MSDTLVHIAHRSGSFERDALGVLVQAAALSEQLGGHADALVVGAQNLDGAKLASLGAFGARTVYSAAGRAGMSQPVIDAMDAVIGAHGHRHAVFGGGVLGLEAGGGLAARRDGGIVVEVTALRVEAGQLVVERPVFDDAQLAVVRFCGEFGVIVTRMDAFAGEPREGAAAAALVEVAAPASPWAERVEVLEQAPSARAALAVEDAEIVIAGGRGLGAAEAFELIEALAAAFGPQAAVGASRAVVDAGWYPYEHQVGQTGKTVTPKLYIAAGISGAIQHRVGMSGAEHIVAINIDSDAPIFALADLGVVGDLHVILPKLTAAVRAHRAD
jgi:electron transfer flavoprotein alpha subunit